MSEHQESKKKANKEEDSEEEEVFFTESMPEIKIEQKPHKPNAWKPVSNSEIARLREQAKSPSGPNFPAISPKTIESKKPEDKKKS